MRSASMLCLCLLAVLCLAVSGFAADRQAIQGNVDGIVSAIDAGKNAQEVQANDYDPYVYIMEQDGTLVVHPELSGQSLKEVAEPVYDAVMRATHDGVWVDYEWKGAQKHSYVRKTEGGLIVGSGYTE